MLWKFDSLPQCEAKLCAAKVYELMTSRTFGAFSSKQPETKKRGNLLVEADDNFHFAQSALMGSILEVFTISLTANVGL